jgi:hypothetical protein
MEVPQVSKLCHPVFIGFEIFRNNRSLVDQPGVYVMYDNNFRRFSTFFGENIGVFLLLLFFAKSSIMNKKREKFVCKFLGRIKKIITSVPENRLETVPLIVKTQSFCFRRENTFLQQNKIMSVALKFSLSEADQVSVFGLRVIKDCPKVRPSRNAFWKLE